MASLSTDSLFRVDGLVALVTGGGTGIGLMITKALALNGASKVYITSRRKEVLEEAAKQSPHGNIIPLVGDVGDKDSILALAEHIRKETGYLNLLVDNAGTSAPDPRISLDMSIKELQKQALETTMEQWDSCFKVNVYGVYYSIMAFLDLLDEGNKRKNYCGGQVKSQVVITSSIGAYSRMVGASCAYRASKAAVTHMAKVLATGFQNFDIRINTIAPGMFPSELAEGLIKRTFDTWGTADGKLQRTQIPEQRMGDEQDMGGTVLYLVSRAGAYNNGSICVVDGGRLNVMPASW